MESNTGVLCKVAAVAAFVLMFIGGIIWGYGARSLFLTLVVWASALLSCLLLFAVGEILSSLSRLEYYASAAMQKANAAEEEAPPKDGWTCKECGTINPQYVVECKKCGTNKFS